MTIKKFIAFLHLVLVNQFFGQDLLIKYNKATRHDGIWNTKTRQWAAAPVYSGISEIKARRNQTTTFFLANISKKSMLISSNGKKIVSPQYDEIKDLQSVNPDLFIVKNKDRYSFYKPGSGILSQLGEFDDYRMMNDSTVKIRRGNKYAIMNIPSEKISAAEFDAILESDPDREDMSGLYVSKKGRWGVCDYAGNTVLDFIYDTIERNYYSPVIKIVKNNKAGLTDLSFKPKVECRFQNFDLAFIKSLPDTFNNLIPSRLDNKWGIIDNTGKWFLPNEYDSILAVSLSGISVVKDHKMGIVDMNNKVRYPFLYNYIARVDEDFEVKSRLKNYFVFNSCADCGLENGRWGMSDSLGNLIHPVNASFIPLNINYNYANENNNGKFDSTRVGYLWNIGGEKKYEFHSVDSSMYENADESGNMYNSNIVTTNSVVTLHGGLTGIVKGDGKILFPILYEDMIFQFSMIESYRTGSISKAHTIPASNAYSSEYNYGFGYTVNFRKPVLAKRNGKWGAVNWSGIEIVPCVYDSIFYDYSVSGYDASDSAFNARGYPRSFFRVYKSGNYGFVSELGNELTPPVIQLATGDLIFPRYDSLISNPSYTSYHDEQTFTQIVAQAASTKIFDVYQTTACFDAVGMEAVCVVKKEIPCVQKGFFNLHNSSTIKLTSEKWYDDILLIEENLRLFKLSDLKDQLTLYNIQGYDSIIDPTSGKRYDRGVNSSEAGWHFLEYFFAQSAGKWFLHNTKQGLPINAGLGFDSVKVLNKWMYKAFSKNRYAYYEFNFKGPFANEAEINFPDEPYIYRMSVRDPVYSPVQYILVDSLENIDAEGNTRDTVVNRVFQIPLITAGKYNLIDENNQLVFKVWADDIIIPPDSSGRQFNLKDRQSVTFDKKHVESKGNWDFIKGSKRSVALLVDGKWSLTTIKEPSTYIDGFKSVTLEGNKWACMKKKKIVYYSVDGLKKIKEK